MARLCQDSSVARTILVALAFMATLATAAGADEPKQVWVVNHGWHVGIAMARADVSPAAWPDIAEQAGDYIEVGWGDGDYYPAHDPSLGMGLRAALRSGSSVLHVAAFDAPPPAFFEDGPVAAVTLSSQGFEVLTRWIALYYARDAAGRPIAIAPGRYGDARFYLATGRYRITDNSNTWVVKGLHAAGCPLDVDTLTAGGVMRQVKRLEPGACR
jgi:uncharacterized protein (TIGR02117 family)